MLLKPSGFATKATSPRNPSIYEQILRSINKDKDKKVPEAVAAPPKNPLGALV